MGDLTLALVIRPGTNPLFPEISSDRQARPRADERPQAVHSNVRTSKPDEPGVIRASLVLVLQFGYGGL
jgi:hypothetical protein